MRVIDLFNSAVSSKINKEGSVYKSIIGSETYTPNVTILQSSDVNCGALCNELEFGRVITDYYINSVNIDKAADLELDTLINSNINLPRRGKIETDQQFVNRFKFIAIEKSNPTRTTKSAILDAISYYVSDMSRVQITELFDAYTCYFQIRFEGFNTIIGALYLNNINSGYLNQNFIGGPSVGVFFTYVTELVNRIKAAGVDFDVIFINQNTITKTSSSRVGRVQKYKTTSADIKNKVSLTKSSVSRIV